MASLAGATTKTESTLDVVFGLLGCGNGRNRLAAIPATLTLLDRFGFAFGSAISATRWRAYERRTASASLAAEAVAGPSEGATTLGLGLIFARSSWRLGKRRGARENDNEKLDYVMGNEATR